MSLTPDSATWCERHGLPAVRLTLAASVAGDAAALAAILDGQGKREEAEALFLAALVASAARLLQTDKADVSTELKSTEITSMPLNRFRNYQALMNLVPGTTPMAFGNAETDTPARSLATNVNGQSRQVNNVQLEGAEAVEERMGGAVEVGRARGEQAELGAAVGDGLVGASMIQGVARQPEAAGRLNTTMFLIIGLCEGMYFINLAFMALFVFVTGAQ